MYTKRAGEGGDSCARDSCAGGSADAEEFSEAFSDQDAVSEGAGWAGERSFSRSFSWSAASEG
jgi:hypothetical protein